MSELECLPPSLCVSLSTMACTQRHAAYCFDVLDAHLAGASIPAYEGEDGNEE